MSMRISMDKQAVQAENQRVAEENRSLFRQNKVTVINLMSSPGAGKTTLLEKTVEQLAGRYKVGVIEGDLATSRDADRIRALGATAVQINTNGGCHLDAHMIAKVLPDFSLSELDYLFIENVGNLVCPATYDLGQHHKVAVLSVPEGNDKIAKYPVMFRHVDLVVLNKVDLLPYLPFDLKQAEEDLQMVHPGAQWLPLSALTGEGFAAWLEWLEQRRQAAVAAQ